MSIEIVFIFLLIATAAAVWAHHSKISLIAANAAKRFIEQQDMQFLDQSVVLKKVRLGWSGRTRPYLERTYEFEFTHHSDYRYTGSVILRGLHIQPIELPPIVETQTLH